MPLNFTSILTTDYNKDKNKIYNKFSPYGSQPTGLFGFGVKQPYVWIKLSKKGAYLNNLKKYESQSIPLGSGPQDLIRMTKMMGSGTGVKFTLTQLMLTLSQPFNETKIYNPLMPILAAASPASMYILPRIQRNLDTSNLLGSFTGGLFGGPSAVPGTTATINAPKDKSGYKGFLRHKTAQNAVNRFTQADPAGGIMGFLGKLGGPIGAAMGMFDNITSMFPSPQMTVKNQTAQYRADEDAYLYKVNPDNPKQKYYNSANTTDNTRTDKNKNKTSYFNIINNQSGDFSKLSGNIGEITTEKGYKTSILLTQNKIDTVYRLPAANLPPGTGTDSTTNFTIFDKNTSTQAKDKVDDIKRQLDKLLLIDPTQIGSLSGGGYTISSYNTEVDLTYYDIGNRRTESSNAVLARNGYQKKYFYGKTLEDDFQSGGKGFAGARGRTDRINTLTILDKNKREINVKYPQTYNPYKDDMIAFYFHDLVNDRYIPFRASVKGISETLQPSWSDITYVGRADKQYNYTGFTRQLSFGFTVICNSIKELLPMWTRINYLCGCVKPSKYTNTSYNLGTIQNIASSFIVPPLMAITIGDLYKEQPIVITNISIKIPDDAQWETLPENNTDSDSNWAYLRNGVIKYTDSKGQYAQMPRVCDIDIGTNLLEKERPQMGGPNFGDGSLFNPSDTNSFSQNLIVMPDTNKPNPTENSTVQETNNTLTNENQNGFNTGRSQSQYNPGQ